MNRWEVNIQNKWVSDSILVILLPAVTRLTEAAEGKKMNYLG